MSRLRSRLVRVFVAIVLLGCSGLSAQVSPGICFECFWGHVGESLKREAAGVYGGYACPTYFCRAEVSVILARMAGDARMLRDAAAFYGFSLQTESPDPARELFLNEVLGFLGPEVGVDPKQFLERASVLAREQGMTWRAGALEEMAAGSFEPEFGECPVKRSLEAPAGATHFVLGESKIEVPRGARTVVQIERTVRDWLSYQVAHGFDDEPIPMEKILDYHEGARLRDLMRLAGATPIPVSGTIAAKSGDRWYAPDENGVFRFLVLNDKIEYPTVKAWPGLAFMTDTHGVSSLVEQAIHEKADIVIGCGDNPGKATAAYYLASKGIDVYMPCDREIGMLLGHDAKGIVLGSAPVKEVGGVTVIGGQPVTFAIGEAIVVSDIEGDSVARYYDSAWKYFSELANLVPLDLRRVVITDIRQAGLVVEEAKRLGAEAIATRVAYEEDYVAVSRWLDESSNHRAVLFHSAPYPPGNRLLHEYPTQVTFGDPRPRFVTRSANGR